MCHNIFQRELRLWLPVQACSRECECHFCDVCYSRVVFEVMCGVHGAVCKRGAAGVSVGSSGYRSAMIFQIKLQVGGSYVIEKFEFHIMCK